MLGRYVGLAATLLLAEGVYAQSSCPDFPVGSLTVSPISNALVALTCASPGTESFPGNKRVLLSRCVDGQWTPQDGTCQTATVLPCEPLVDPEFSEVTKDFSDSGGLVYKYYTCQSGMAWLSGTSGQLTECVDGEWTPVLDMCTEECTFPRDCVSVLALGMNETNLYNIIPFPDPDGDAVTVWCDQESDGYENSGGGWTTIYRRKTGVAFDGISLDWYKRSQGEPDRTQDGNFFIGLDNLVAMNRDTSGNRPLVFQFLFAVDGEPLYHATYDDVVIGDSPEYTLLQVGIFHGNAGDSFTQHVGYNFLGVGQEFWWIPDGGTDYMSYLAKDGAEWKTLTDNSKQITTVTLRVRPKEFDAAITCPPQDVMDIDWMGAGESTWEGGLTLGRLPGDIINYTCVGDLMMAGPGGSEGIVACEASAVEGESPAWNSTFELPCVFTCPDGFVNSANTTCYHVSTTPAVQGIVDAARRCGTLGSTLAKIDDIGDMAEADNDKFYFTAHTITAPDTINPSLSFLTCSTSCLRSAETDCVAVKGPDLYAAKDCEADDIYYMCQLPEYCPDATYKPFKGMCYKLIDGVTNHVGALETCIADGAALAFPEDEDTLSYLKRLFMQGASAGGALVTENVIIGLNDAMGDWTADGLYSPSSEVITQAGTSDGNHWRLLTISSTKSDPVTLTATSLASSGATKAFCQFPGPMGCSKNPPEPTDNMTRTWDNSTALSTVITYECDYGYFVNGNISVTEQTVTCLGQLGGWFPAEIPDCYRVEVCHELPVAPSPDITNTSAPDLRYLGGTVNLTCPPLMATSQQVTDQVFTCSIDGTGFAFLPKQVDACSVCIGEVSTANATTTWSNTSVWSVNDEVTATCATNYLVRTGVTDFTITCNATGWQHGGVCYEGCVDEPPDAGTNMTRDAVNRAEINTFLHYNCSPGYYIPPTKDRPTPLERTRVTCGANHTWIPEGPALSCSKLCLSSPPTILQPGNSTWDGFSKVVGTTFELSCPENFFFLDLNNSVSVECGDDGKWTNIGSQSLTCTRVCSETLPVEPEDSSLVVGEPPYWEGATASYVCAPGMLSPAGEQRVTLQCTTVGWTELDPEFACANSCMSDPPRGPARVQSNYTGGRLEGTVIEYRCSIGFYGLPQSDNSTLTSTCQGGKWTVPTLPFCGGKKHSSVLATMDKENPHIDIA